MRRIPLRSDGSLTGGKNNDGQTGLKSTTKPKCLLPPWFSDILSGCWFCIVYFVGFRELVGFALKSQSGWKEDLVKFVSREGKGREGKGSQCQCQCQCQCRCIPMPMRSQFSAPSPNYLLYVAIGLYNIYYNNIAIWPYGHIYAIIT